MLNGAAIPRLSRITRRHRASSLTPYWGVRSSSGSIAGFQETREPHLSYMPIARPQTLSYPWYFLMVFKRWIVSVNGIPRRCAAMADVSLVWLRGHLAAGGQRADQIATAGTAGASYGVDGLVNVRHGSPSLDAAITVAPAAARAARIHECEPVGDAASFLTVLYRDIRGHCNRETENRRLRSLNARVKVGYYRAPSRPRARVRRRNTHGGIGTSKAVLRNPQSVGAPTRFRFNGVEGEDCRRSSEIFLAIMTVLGSRR